MSKSKKTLIIAIFVMALWGSLFPFIKIGYAAFNINTQNVSDILMFAGMRFFVCGVIVTALALLKGERIGGKKSASVFWIMLSGLFSTILHYSFTYVGLSLTESSKTAILKQSGALIYICVAFIFVKEERFSFNKLFGGIIGFLGVMAVNFGKGKIMFSLGDILIIAASFCTVFANLAGKKAMRETGAILFTGVSQLFGGLALLIIGALGGAKLPGISLYSAAVFLYICFASIAAYCLWYNIVSKNELSGLLIIKFAEPVFAAIFGWLLLGENIFKWQYLAAFFLISAGIVIASTPKKKKLSLN